MGFLLYSDVYTYRGLVICNIRHRRFARIKQNSWIMRKIADGLCFVRSQGCIIKKKRKKLLVIEVLSVKVFFVGFLLHAGIDDK